MNKHLDKLKKRLYFNNNLFVFLFVLILVGVGAGALFSTILNTADKHVVSTYLNNFFTQFSGDMNISFFNNFVFTLGFAFIIWIFGISVIGILLILPFLFFKAFVLGFGIGSILINYKFKGIIFSLICVVPHRVVNLLIYVLISAYALMISYRMIVSMKDRKSFDFRLFMNRYLFILFFSFIILSITSLYESFVLPYFMKFIVNLLK
ncbi:MAG: stage II sporulation protein M [Bacilli bacterium]|nr:stage II sporulation protein M [Bacilli bacterium]